MTKMNAGAHCSALPDQTLVIHNKQSTTSVGGAVYIRRGAVYIHRGAQINRRGAIPNRRGAVNASRGASDEGDASDPSDGRTA